MILSGAMVLLLVLSGFVSHISTKAVERAIIASAADLMELKSSRHQWEFLRDGMVLGRIVSEDDAVYVFTLRLFGGDYRYAIALQEDGRPRAYADLGIGPASPHSARISRVMMEFAGEPLDDSSALDPQIKEAIMASIQTIAMQERSRKEATIGQ
jgi:hypothetical protein